MKKNLFLLFLLSSILILSIQSLATEPELEEFLYTYKDGQMVKVENIKETESYRKKPQKTPEWMKDENWDLWNYESDNLDIHIDEMNNGHALYWIAQIYIDEPFQINSALAYDAYNSGRQTTSTITKNHDGILGINASAFTFDTGKQGGVANQIIINNGTILNDGETNTQNMCLKWDGTIYSPETLQTGTDLIYQNVKASFWFGPCLVKDGQDFFSTTFHVNSDSPYPRTAIGMIDTHNYVVVVADGKGSNGSNGLTQKELVSIFLNLGCTYAFNLDGGGSSALYFKGRLVNKPSDGQEREVGDIIYFSDILDKNSGPKKDVEISEFSSSLIQ